MLWCFVVLVLSLSSCSSQNDGLPTPSSSEFHSFSLELCAHTRVVYTPIKGAGCPLQSLPEGLGWILPLKLAHSRGQMLRIYCGKHQQLNSC